MTVFMDHCQVVFTDIWGLANMLQDPYKYVKWWDLEQKCPKLASGKPQTFSEGKKHQNITHPFWNVNFNDTKQTRPSPPVPLTIFFLKNCNISGPNIGLPSMFRSLLIKVLVFNHGCKWSNHHYTQGVWENKTCEWTQKPFHYASKLCTPLILLNDEVYVYEPKADNYCQTGSHNLCKSYIFNQIQMLFYFRFNHRWFKVPALVGKDAGLDFLSAL